MTVTATWALWPAPVIDQRGNRRAGLPITVYLPGKGPAPDGDGTLVKARLYTDDALTAAGPNPITTNADGNETSIKAAPGSYDAYVDGETIRIIVLDPTASSSGVAAEAAARAAADALLIPLTQKGAANGVATLGADSKIPSAQLPALAIGESFVVASQAAMLALTAQRGDVAVRTDLTPNGFFLLTSDSPGTLADWVQITAAGGVFSVDGLTGAVALSGVYVAKAGATMTGPLVLPGAPTVALHAATKAYVDANASAPGVVTVLQFDGTNGMMVGHGLFWETQGVDLGPCLWETWCRHDGNGYVLSEGYGGAHRVLYGWSGGNPTGNMYYVGAPAGVASHAGLYVAEVGEWVHLAQAFDGDWMYLFVNGICVGRWAQPESRAQVGQGTTFVGGSDHQNMTGALFQSRGFEGNCGYRAANAILVGFKPERIFGGAAANGVNRAALLADYSAPTSAIVPDASDGFNSKRHPGVLGGSGGDIAGLGALHPPVRVADAAAPFLGQAGAARTRTPPGPASVPSGAKIYDSFGRADTIPCWVADSAVRLGSTEGGSLGPLAWQGDDGHYCRFDGCAVTVRGNEPWCTYCLNTTSNFDGHVIRPAAAATYGIHITSFAFRVVDSSNYLMLYLDTSTELFSLPAFVTLYEVVAGTPTPLMAWAEPNNTWTKLRATGAGSTINAYVDDGAGGWTSLGSFATTRFQSALGVGIANYYDTGTLGRWSSLAVFAGAAAVAPSAPVIGTAVAAGPTSITVPHTAASDGGSPITSTTVTPYIAGVAQTPQVFTDALTTHTASGLTTGTTYTFKVKVTTAVGTSPDSAASNATAPSATVPAAPTIGTATAGNTLATVTHTANGTGGSPITGATITPYIGATAQTPQTFMDTALTHDVTGLTNGTTYTFKVALINAVGTGSQSAASNAVTPAITAPATPGLFGAYEADAVTGFVDGGKPGTWPDASPAANDLATGFPTLWEPTYKTSIFGTLPAMRFTGGAVSVEKAYAAPISNPTTFFVVWKYNGATSDNPAFMDGGAVNERNVQGLAAGLNLRITGSTSLAGPGSIFDNAAHQWTFIFNGASSKIRLDGVEVASGDAGNVAMTGLILGCYANHSAGAAVDIGAVRCSSAALSGPQIAAEEAYLKTKYGTP